MMGVELLFIFLLPAIFFRAAIDLILPLVVIGAAILAIYLFVTRQKKTKIKVIAVAAVMVPLIIWFLYGIDW